MRTYPFFILFLVLLLCACVSVEEPTSSCNQLDLVTERNLCWGELALEQSQIELCYKLDDEGQAREEGQHPMYVLREASPYTRKCIYAIIEKTENYSLCNYVPGNGYILKCFARRAKLTQDISVCGLAEKEDVRRYCYAIMEEDITYCIPIKNNYQRLLCIVPFAVKGKDASLCGYIEGMEEFFPLRNECCHEVEKVIEDISVEECQEYLDKGGYSGINWKL